jgi:CBS domain containing-hemolysin-like protein
VVTTVAAIVAALSALLAALCAGADGAVLSLTPEMALSPRLAGLRERRERVHRTLAFARVIGHLGTGGGVATLVVAQGLAGWRFALAIGVGAVLLVALTESIARSIGNTRAVPAATRLAGLVMVLEGALAPVVAMGELMERTLNTWLPAPPVDDDDREAMAEQFKQVVAAEAEVSADEQVLLNGVFRLAQAEVHEIMVPRIDVVAVDQSAPWHQVVERVRSSEHSRVPVFADSIDNVVGVLYAKDMLPAVLAGTEPGSGWRSLVRPPVFIPRSKLADRQLRDFQATRSHLAVVVDEYGGTEGIITIEDVLEEIVGDIRDEYDVEEAPIEHLDGQRLRVSARLTLNELSDLLRHDFERDDISTVGGLVYEQFGRAPKAGESFQIAGYRVTVDRVERRRVQRVTFERLHQAGSGHAA